MAKCPKCAEDLGSGFLDEATHKERLDAKERRNKELADELKAARTKAEAHDVAVRERDEARSQLAEVETRASRSVALAQAGVTDDRASKRVESIYGIYKAEEGEAALGFGEWLAGPAREDVLAGPLLVGKGAAAPGTAGKADAGKGGGAAPGATAPRPNPLPNANAGAKADAPPPGKLTEAQARAAYAKRADELRRTEPDPKKRQAALAQTRAELDQQIGAKAA